MMSLIHRIENWFSTAKPEPTTKDFHTQLGVHFEEVGEMLDTITSMDTEATSLLAEANLALGALATYLKGSDNVITIMEKDRIEFLDSVCDQIVTATGCAQQIGMNVDGSLNEVNNSNWSKFDKDGNPFFNEETRKIMKGPDYFKPELSPYV